MPCSICPSAEAPGFPGWVSISRHEASISQLTKSYCSACMRIYMQDSPSPWLAGADIASTCSTARRGSVSSIPTASQPRQRQHVSAIGGLHSHRAVPSRGPFKSAAAAYGTPRESPPPQPPTIDAAHVPGDSAAEP